MLAAARRCPQAAPPAGRVRRRGLHPSPLPRRRTTDAPHRACSTLARIPVKTHTVASWNVHPPHRPARSRDARDFHYLDNAATVFPKPDSVLRGHVLLLSPARREPRTFRLRSRPSRRDSSIDATRRALDGFFHNPAHDHNRLIFAANASDALNLLIQGLVRPGDHVVSTQLEHNSVLRPLYVLEDDGVITHDLVAVRRRRLRRSGRDRAAHPPRRPVS